MPFSLVAAGASGLEVIFKGRSPNVDVCSTGADSSCINIKFGKIEERGPDATRKVNAHSIMSLASRNNLPTWTSGLTTYGSSDSVTFVKMALDRSFSRSCSNSGRDGGEADPNARPRPNRRAATVQMGSMVAQMPTKAMVAAPVADGADPAPSLSTNITVTTTNKGVEFMFPAFAELYYDPIIASESSFDACTSCELDTTSGTDTTDASGGDTPACVAAQVEDLTDDERLRWFAASGSTPPRAVPRSLRELRISQAIAQR